MKATWRWSRGANGGLRGAPQPCGGQQLRAVLGGTAWRSGLAGAGTSCSEWPWWRWAARFCTSRTREAAGMGISGTSMETWRTSSRSSEKFSAHHSHQGLRGAGSAPRAGHWAGPSATGPPLDRTLGEKVGRTARVGGRRCCCRRIGRSWNSSMKLCRNPHATSGLGSGCPRPGRAGRG